MSSPINAILTGTFTSNGAVRQISLPSGYSKFELVNITDIGDAGATTQVMRARSYSSLPAGSAYLNLKTNGAATLAIESMITTAGLTFVADSGSQSLGAAVAITGITNANPAVASSASTAVVGDVVRVYGTTAQLQIAGMDFSVTAVNPGVTQTFGYLNAAGFANAATAGFMRIVPFDPRFYPRRRFITGITQAASAVVTMSVAHGYIVGEKVRLIVPSEFGMTQMNGLLGTITAITTGATNTITVDIDSTGFTAFAFPLTAVAAAGITFAQVIPVGEAATAPYSNLLDDATANRSFNGVVVGTGVQTTGKVYQWIAEKGLTI
jgi:hypothetical protein